MKLKSLLDNMPSRQRVLIIEYGTFNTIYEGTVQNVEGHMDIKHRKIIYLESLLHCKNTSDEEISTTIKIHVTKQLKERE